MILLREVAEEVGASPEQHRPPHRPLPKSAGNVVTDGIVAYEAAIEMITIFKQHYGRWVSLDETRSPEETLLSLQTSPLFLCAVCLIAVRHMDAMLAAALVEPLFLEAKSLLSAALLNVPQDFDFFSRPQILSY